MYLVTFHHRQEVELSGADAFREFREELTVQPQQGDKNWRYLKMLLNMKRSELRSDGQIQEIFILKQLINLKSQTNTFCGAEDRILEYDLSFSVFDLVFH